MPQNSQHMIPEHCVNKYRYVKRTEKYGLGYACAEAGKRYLNWLCYIQHTDQKHARY